MVQFANAAIIFDQHIACIPREETSCIFHENIKMGYYKIRCA